MRHNRLPKISDRGINFDGYLNIVRQTNKLNNIQFDPTIFVIQDDPSGMYISMNPQSVSTTAANVSGYHLSGEVTQSNCAGAGGELIVRGGVSCRKTNSDVYIVPLTCDSGPSEHYDDYYTLTGITSSRYVYAELDDPLKPTTMVINTSASYPDDDANKYTKFVLGYANVASDVLTWEPYREMDLIPDSPVLPDANMDPVANRTVAFKNADGRLELYGVSNAASKMVVGIEPTGTGVDVVYRDCNVASIAIGTGANAAGTLDSIARSDHYHHISAADYANSAGHATWADTANAVSSAVTHSLLYDVLNHSESHDDHGPGGTNFVLLSKTGDAARNKCDFGLADNAGRWSIKTTARSLIRWDGVSEAICASWSDGKWWGDRFGGDGFGHSGYCSLSFINRCGYSGAGDYYKTIDWNLGYLYDGSAVAANITLKWTTGKLSYMAWEAENAQDITPETYSGGFLIAGGATCAKTFQADRFTILDDNDNYWTANVFSAVATNDIVLDSPVIHFGNSAAVGITLANWTKVGGVIGADIVPTTIFANTGSSIVEMEVLARIL